MEKYISPREKRKPAKQKHIKATYIDLPRGAEWMIRGAYTPSFRVQTAPFGRCWKAHLCEKRGSRYEDHLLARSFGAWGSQRDAFGDSHDLAASHFADILQSQLIWGDEEDGGRKNDEFSKTFGE